MSSSSLSSVVSNLVRASMGSSIPSTVTDEELDRCVADLIVKEAKQKAERYLEEGVRAYLPEKESDSNLPRANKRFLSAIIRNTDEHNRAILKAQADAAQEAKAEREEQERRERQARALEATEAGRLRRLMGGSSRRRDREWDRHRDGGRGRRSRDSHDGESLDYQDEPHDRRKRCRSHSRSIPGKEGDSDRRRRRRHRDEGRDDSSSRKPRRRSKSRIPEDEHRKSSRRHEFSQKHRRRDEPPEVSRRPSKGKGKAVEEHREARATPLNDEVSEASDDESKNKLDFSRQASPRSLSPLGKASPRNLSAQFKERKAKFASTPPPPASPTLSEEEDIERYRPRGRRRLPPGPSVAREDVIRSISPGPLPSKMDRYFEETYDPRLDTGPLTVPDVPSTGLIDGAQFEGWDAMLDIIRQRREDRIERKRQERLGLLPDKTAKEKDGKASKSSEAWTMESGTSAMDIAYNKRGTVREWDLGKAGF